MIWLQCQRVYKKPLLASEWFPAKQWDIYKSYKNANTLACLYMYIALQWYATPSGSSDLNWSDLPFHNSTRFSENHPAVTAEIKTRFDKIEAKWMCTNPLNHLMLGIQRRMRWSSDLSIAMRKNTSARENRSATGMNKTKHRIGFLFVLLVSYYQRPDGCRIYRMFPQVGICLFDYQSVVVS